MAPSPAGHLSGSKYAHGRKQLLQLMAQLRSVGAQGELDLPRITVIGNQSAGKSSVVEAISGINVPRDAGTCTRCPMECRLSSSIGAWSCSISIRLESDDAGRPLAEVAEFPFCEVFNKEDVELALRRAQFAVLHPSVKFGEILQMDAEKLKNGVPNVPSLAFSRNVVCVDLEGPDLTDLMFLDLPGIIQNADRETVQLVEDMVVSHIGGNSLILVALPMTDDIENQKALRLAREEDPEGRRTIGVLTKPDMLNSKSNAAKNWLDVIEGRTHLLQHGYYCTRQPDDAERANNITAEQARSAEERFFRTEKPWAAAGAEHRDRLGTANLVATLSSLLEQIMNEQLPFIMDMANSRLDACRHELSTLPEKLLGDPATHMLNLVTGFAAEIRHYVDGDGGEATSGLIHGRNTAFTAFKTAIRNTQPRFVARVAAPLSAGKGKAKGDDATMPIDLDEDEEGEVVPVRKGKPQAQSAVELVEQGKEVYLADIKAHLAKSITRELPGNIPFSAKKSLIVAFQTTWTQHAVVCFDTIRASFMELLGACMDKRFGRYSKLAARMKELLADLVTRIHHSCAAFLIVMLNVENMPYTQNDHYLQSATEKWASRYKEQRAGGGNGMGAKPQRDWEEDVGPPSKKRKLTISTSNANGTGRRSEPTSADSSRSGSVAPNWSKGFLPDPPHLNGNGHGSRSAGREDRERDWERATRDRERDREREQEDTANEALTLLAKLGYPGLKVEDLGKLREGDIYETEMMVMAEVRGYFQCAYKRIIDNIPLLIDAQFLQALGQALQQELITAFELGKEGATAMCAAYLTEDPRVVARREALEGRRKMLEAVQQQLRAFAIVGVGA
ncbi:hypothetical protein MKEN_00457600 [Mycena kentingensis (nom. inval.)]|nr:hypothetical protein MKEN_00457600 [Mycena kentingensis (nom. inval.)]